MADTPDRSLTGWRPKIAADCPTVAVVEGVEKPGNLGAIIRSADGAGVAAVLSVDGRTDLFHPNTIRASLGTVFASSVRHSTFFSESHSVGNDVSLLTPSNSPLRHWVQSSLAEATVGKPNSNIAAETNQPCEFDLQIDIITSKY